MSGQRATAEVQLAVFPDGSALLAHDSGRSVVLGTDGGAHASVHGERVHLGLFMMTQWVQWLATGHTWGAHYPEGL